MEVRTNIIPGKNDDIRELERIAQWIRDNLTDNFGETAPWHITRFFPAYKLSHVPTTPSETLWAAHGAAKKAGLKHSYVYDDKGCDCATDNQPVHVYLQQDAQVVHQVKKCAASCCGQEGILLKKYEKHSA